MCERKVSSVIQKPDRQSPLRLEPANIIGSLLDGKLGKLMMLPKLYIYIKY